MRPPTTPSSHQKPILQLMHRIRFSAMASLRLEPWFERTFIYIPSISIAQRIALPTHPSSV
jgi:hypothetical protein